MKRTALRRTTPLLRKKRMTKRPPKRKGEDREYLAFVRGRVCELAGWTISHVCKGRIVAHHAGGLAEGRGMGLKPSDRTCIALCWQAHEDWHNECGFFEGWTKDMRLTWSRLRIAETQAAYTRLLVASGLEAPF